MKTNPNPNLRHPLVIFGNEKGGTTRSTSCAAVADALIALGYNVRLADGDPLNRTLSVISPAAEMIDCRNSKELRAFIAAGPKSEADISMIDMPGYSADSLAAVTRLKTFDGLGVRIIIVLTLTETPDSVLGATAWVENFMDQAEFVVLANAKDTPFGQTFTLDGISGAKRVLALAEGRTVHIPRWSDYMRGHYDRAKGMPSDYIVGGRVYKELKLNPLSAAPWKMQHRRVTASVANVAESLTGKPARKPAPEIEEGRITVLTPKPAGTAE